MSVGTSLLFAGNNLQTTNVGGVTGSNIVISDIDHHGTANKDAKIYPRAHANGSELPFVNYPSRTIKVSGQLEATSIANLDALEDTFRSYLVGSKQNLDIGFNGGTRRYIATVNGPVNIPRPGGLLYATFVIEFECTSAFGQDTTSMIALNATGRTLGSYSDSYSFNGNAPYQMPIVTITLTAVTSTGAQSIQWGNSNNGQSIIVTRTWSAGDVLVIDCTQSSLTPVTVNGAAVAYSGAFPQFPSDVQAGAQTMSYSDGFTTRTFSENVIYVPRYM